MVNLPARELNTGDYIHPPGCNGWHRVIGVKHESWCPGNITVRVNGGAWFPRPDTLVRIAFSGVELCSLNHDAMRKLLP